MDDTSDVADQKKRTRLSFDPKSRFPSKLYDVANDGVLVKWNPNGTSIVVEEGIFEDRVMKCYPGFVQIASFLNLRRLFREYSFDWHIVEGTDTFFEFSHPAFIRNREDLLDEITTKRKSVRRPFSLNRSPAPLATSSPNWYVKRRYRQRAVNKQRPLCFDRYCSNSSSSVERADSGCNLSATRSNSDFSQTTLCNDYRPNGIKDLIESSSLQLYTSTHILNSSGGNSDRLTQQDLLNVLAVYAKNELTEEEYLQLLANTAVDDQIVCNQDMVRESISSLSVPSYSLQEFGPFNHNGDFKPWTIYNEMQHIQETTDNKSAVSHAYNNAEYTFTQSNGNMEYVSYSYTGTSNKMDSNLDAEYAEYREQCDHKFCEAEQSSSLCELRSSSRSSLFDTASTSGQICDPYVQPIDVQHPFVDLNMCKSSACDLQQFANRPCSSGMSESTACNFTNDSNSLVCEYSDPNHVIMDIDKKGCVNSKAFLHDYEQDIRVPESNFQEHSTFRSSASEPDQLECEPKYQMWTLQLPI